MDTVEPGQNIKVTVDEGIVRSSKDSILGADDKAAIAALLEVVDVLRENDLQHPPLELLFTVGEEQGLQGARLFDFSRLQAKMAYVLDSGGSPGSIVIKSPCQNEIEYRVHGRAAHAGINPQDA
ncbi:M20/M25/M40 family metallo-hydrolase [Syntrophomonas palmitatica]|uniref:M20/M25/M40 family metallo-hydrolase n=1 Tax=Syntrophomonas palmitatica TaxID=402877 RepID=UPI0006D1872F|nr:M20/M25/M40 family metallo-hydrolase [Syntrophomonas palmitatica]